jgi:hypothetical protein
MIFNEKITSIKTYPQKDSDIKFLLMFISTFAHPTVMFKKEVFKQLKYKHYAHAEDYKLWTDIALSGFSMSNLNKVLLKYRSHDNQISKINSLEQRANGYKISQNYLLNIGELKNVASLIKDIQNNATKNVLGSVYLNISLYSGKHKISNDALIIIYRYIFRMCSTTNIGFFLVYRKYTKGIVRDVRGDIYLFMQSLFLLNKDSKIYNFLKRFV